MKGNIRNIIKNLENDLGKGRFSASLSVSTGVPQLSKRSFRVTPSRAYHALALLTKKRRRNYNARGMTSSDFREGGKGGVEVEENSEVT